MKKLKNLLLLSGIIWTTTASHAINYEDRDCVHSYNIMNKFVGKVIPNEKVHSNMISMKIHSDLAKTHATDTVMNCKYVRLKLSYKAQENFDELVAIDEAVKYVKEYIELEAELERVISEV
ncbi:MAG: hypothetical protein DRG09_06465 [Epsilonproteobacteria bacterium]|nr:MAG: hypothetical protein DRG09_06465 [Campylobacterota bacterium]